MTTIRERMYDSTIGAASGRGAGMVGHLEHLSLWLVVAAYATVSAVLLVGASVLVLYIGEVLPGMAGIVAFFTLGLALIAAAPTAARVLFTRALGALDDRQKSAGCPARPAAESTVNSVLVVLDADDPATALRAVMGDPATVGAEFHLLLVVPTAEYEARRQARIDAGVTGPYTVDHLTEAARRDAQRVGREYLDTDGEGFEAVGAVGRTRDYVGEAVRNHDYERVYVPGRRRTAWQRLLGSGDISRELDRVLPDDATVEFTADLLGSNADETDADAVDGSAADPVPRSTGR